MSLADYFTSSKPRDPFVTALHADWYKILRPEFTKPYFKKLKAFVEKEYAKKTVYPPKTQMFRAFELTPFKRVQVIILAQDPYPHQQGQAEGLAFSVPKGIAIPSSLRNIFKELRDDIKGFEPAKHGSLVHWAEQGVLLLNTVLTVRAHKPNSHKGKGWEQFTDAVIRTINARKNGVVFLLWGRHAQAKAKLIDDTKHHILKAAHPSGLSAERGFFGCKHFSMTNGLLVVQKKTPIQWGF